MRLVERHELVLMLEDDVGGRDAIRDEFCHACHTFIPEIQEKIRNFARVCCALCHTSPWDLTLTLV